MSSISRTRLFGLLGAVAMMLATTAGLAPRAQAQVAVLVNGQPITELDIRQRQRLEQLSTRKNPPRSEVLQTLIDDKLKLKEAARFKITASNSEVDRAFATIASRSGRSPEEFARLLEKSGVRAETLKARIKADMTWARLVRGRFQASLKVGEKDILLALEKRNDDSNGGPAYEYTLQHIIMVVPSGSSRSAVAARQREAQALRRRFGNCERGIPFARALRGVAVREEVRRNSADLPAALRKQLDEVQVGQLTKPEVTKNGIEMFAVCGRRVTTTNTVNRREARDALIAKRFKRKAESYLEDLRRGAMIERR